jgi:hypothetical protein
VARVKVLLSMHSRQSESAAVMSSLPSADSSLMPSQELASCFGAAWQATTATGRAVSRNKAGDALIESLPLKRCRSLS